MMFRVRGLGAKQFMMFSLSIKKTRNLFTEKLHMMFRGEGARSKSSS